MPVRIPFRWLALSMIGWMVIGAPDRASAQRRNVGRVPNRAAIVERPAAIENLLKRAADGIERQNWKLAIDSLQRVLDDEVGGLVQMSSPPGRETIYYRSARDQALQMLASLPPEGLEAYRVLHDGRSRALLERGIESGDTDLLREVVDRYLFTSVGAQAAIELAGWYLDVGNFVGALDLINRVERMAPDDSTPAWRRNVIRSVALAGVGALQDARRLIIETESLDLPQDARDATAIIRVALDSIASDAQSFALGENWPIRGGGLTRSGIMSDVSPVIREGLPWRCTLPSDDADWWETQGISQAREKLAFPVADAVIWDNRVFVKANHQITAMDLESLEPLWISEQPVVLGRHRGAMANRNLMPFGRRNSTSMRAMTASDHRLYDVVGGTVTAAFDKVYSIEREGVGGVGSAPIERRPVVLEGTRLEARYASDGYVSWQRGRSGDAADPLNGVYFLAPPVAIRDELWLPLAKGGDIYLAAVSPQDGELLRMRLLCSVELSQIASQYHEAMYLTSDGHSAFVSTGLGLVVAVDIDSFSLRWATQYDRDVTTMRRTSYEPRFWRSSPPVIAGKRIIVAPIDADSIMGLEATTGQLEWTVRRPDHARFVLGADESRVWLGGEQTSCLSAADGSRIWSSADSGDSFETGRAALCGSRIWVPTVDGVTALEADTGKVLERLPLPEDQLPLGNLLCAASALFSVDTNEVRKFPDLTLSYPRQLALFEEQPDDHRTAIRLAWMELLRDQPQRANQVLEQLPPSPIESLQKQIARLKVKSLLSMSASDNQVAVAVEQLREALGLAALVGAHREQLEAAVNLAARLRETGRMDEAYMTLWRAGMSNAADGYLTIAPRLRLKARRYLADRMSKMTRDLSARHLQVIAENTGAVFAETMMHLESGGDGLREALRQMHKIAELNDAGGAGQRAMLALGRYERDQMRFARSEQYFKWAIRASRVAKVSAVARYELAASYLHPAQQLHHEAKALLDTINQRFDDVVIDESGVRLGAEKARLLAAIDDRLAAEGAFASSPGRFSFVRHTVTDEYAWMDPPSLGAQLVSYATSPSEILGRNVLTFSAPNIIEAFSSRDGILSWRSEVRLLDDGDAELPELATTNRAGVFPRIFCDGQTGVLNGPGGLYGLGVATGRRLWAMPYEEDSTETQYPLRNRLVAVEDGVVVFAPRRGVLTAASLLDADDVLWERIVAGEKLDTVFVEDGLCITLDSARRTARTYALADGRLISQVKFGRQPVDDIVRPLVYVDGMLIGPEELDRVIAFDVRTGREIWRHSGAAEIRWLFSPGDGYVGVWSISAEVTLLDAFDGTTVMTAQLADMEKHLAEGVIHDDTLVLMPVGKSERGAVPVLYGVSVSSGKVLWVRDGFDYTGPSREAWWRVLKMADGVVPMAVKLPVESENRFVRSVGNIGLVSIDMRTGRNVGPMVMTDRAASDAEHLTGDFALFGRRMIFATRRGLMSIDVQNE